MMNNISQAAVLSIVVWAVQRFDSYFVMIFVSKTIVILVVFAQFRTTKIPLITANSMEY